MDLSIIPAILIIFVLFFGRNRFGDLADGIGNWFNMGPPGGPPTHPLPVTGEAETSRPRNLEK